MHFSVNKPGSATSLAARFLPVAATILSSGCEADRPHSILDPAGPHAQHIADLWWQMFAVLGIVFAATLLALVLALTARRSEKPLLGSRFVIITGIAIPTIIVVALLIQSMRVMSSISGDSGEIRIQVVSHHWWFEVRYPDHGIVDANEIHVPTGRTVLFELRSSGMVHSFWVPRLGGKRDLLPDHPTELTLKADKPGIYQGTCTEYCAGPHALMAFRLVAHEPEEFRHWLRKAKRQPPVPTDQGLQHGRSVFINAGCGACHSISGLSEANAGPDLTLIGSRLTLGAGELPNIRGNLSGWIADPQSLKPGNMMPRFYLSPEELHALVDYLESLK